MAWQDSVDDDEAARRAGGRRHYNARRRLAREYRRTQVANMLLRRPPFEWGAASAIARELGVHRSTICKDLRALGKEWAARHAADQALRALIEEAIARATTLRRE
jgi:hypothetical protein